MCEIRPYRSVLYMPGSNARALEKAKSLKADAYIFDLEDAVAPASKDIAREQVVAALNSGGFGSREVIVRINSLDTEWGMSDLAEICAAKPAAILFPKISTVDDLSRASKLLAKHAGDASIKLWSMMETPLGILNAQDIAAAATDGPIPLTCFVIGTNDLAKDLRCQQTPKREALLPALATVLLAARAHGLTVIDGVFNDLQDEEGFAEACCQSSEMGFDGKSLIHPSQIAACNCMFAPSPEEIADATNIIDIFADPENRLVGAIKLDGRMVERLHTVEAHRIVALSNAIEQLG